MTIEEKRRKLIDHCDRTDCDKCKLKERCLFDAGDMSSESIELAYKAFTDVYGEDTVKSTPSCGKPLYDAVERPQHYAVTSIECIDAMIETQGTGEVIGFCVCNAFKYLWRHRMKNGNEDIRKAAWYLNKAVELMDK